MADGRCRSCGALMLWTVTEKGKRMPMDPEPYTGPSPSGLFVLRRVENSDAPLAVATTPDAFPGESVYISHFATCPNSSRHRKGNRAAH